MLRKYVSALLLAAGLCGGLIMATPLQGPSDKRTKANSQRDKCFRKCSNTHKDEMKACEGKAWPERLRCERKAKADLDACNDECGRKFGKS